MSLASRARAIVWGSSTAVVVACSPAVAAEVTPTEKPFLWMIAGETPSFLFGTVHLPDDRVLALPDVVEAAFEATDALYTEIPMNPTTMLASLSAMQLANGKTLSDVLPAELVTRAEAYLERRGLSIALFSRFKVAFFAAQLTLLDELENLATRQPLDAVLFSRASEAGKEARALETVDEQLAIFDAFDEKEAAAMLRMTLDYLEGLDADSRSPTEELIELYLEGDGEALASKMYEYFDPKDAFTRKFVDLAITQRNRRMAERIDEWTKKEPDRVHFFAVGALHYPMDVGLIELLRTRGYEIERLSPADAERVRELAMAPSGR
jgi:uncharacterized protein YbaP (TraB family)